MKIAWLTDIHINFLEKNERDIFYKAVAAQQSDAILITGDIAEAPSVSFLLQEMQAALNIPIYFVLGNHDYYKGYVADVRQEIAVLTKTSAYLRWLPVLEAQQLSNDIYLVGQDGWADGRLGDYANSNLVLNDCRFIRDLIQQHNIGKNNLLAKMMELGDIDANNLQQDLNEAINKGAHKIIIATHVPPFKESCYYEGKMSTDDYLPYFSSKATGDVLSQFATTYPEVDFLVFCGHTHAESFYQPFSNLTVKTGSAKYGHPKVQEVLEL